MPEKACKIKYLLGNLADNLMFALSLALVGLNRHLRKHPNIYVSYAFARIVRIAMHCRKKLFSSILEVKAFGFIRSAFLLKTLFERQGL